MHILKVVNDGCEGVVLHLKTVAKVKKNNSCVARLIFLRPESAYLRWSSFSGKLIVDVVEQLLQVAELKNCRFGVLW